MPPWSFMVCGFSSKGRGSLICEKPKKTILRSISRGSFLPSRLHTFRRPFFPSARLCVRCGTQGGGEFCLILFIARLVLTQPPSRFVDRSAFFSWSGMQGDADAATQVFRIKTPPPHFHEARQFGRGSKCLAVKASKCLGVKMPGVNMPGSPKRQNAWLEIYKNKTPNKIFG